MKFLMEPHRIYAEGEKNKLLAEVTFPETKNGLWDINHTFVDDSLRGQGIAGKLMEAVAKQAEAKNKKLLPTCSYAVQWFEKHKEYQELLWK